MSRSSSENHVYNWTFVKRGLLYQKHFDLLPYKLYLDIWLVRSLIFWIIFQQGKREQANVQYHTSLPVLFGVKKYADALWEVVKERNINVNLSSCLVEVKSDKKEAIFENLLTQEKVRRNILISYVNVITRSLYHS